MRRNPISNKSFSMTPLQFWMKTNTIDKTSSSLRRSLRTLNNCKYSHQISRSKLISEPQYSCGRCNLTRSANVARKGFKLHFRLPCPWTWQRRQPEIGTGAKIVKQSELKSRFTSFPVVFPNWSTHSVILWCHSLLPDNTCFASDYYRERRSSSSIGPWPLHMSLRTRSFCKEHHLVIAFLYINSMCQIKAWAAVHHISGLCGLLHRSQG